MEEKTVLSIKGEKKQNDRLMIIALIGPESSGKTTLSNQLSSYYQSPVVYEYGREYLEKIKRHYRFSDLEIIAKQHKNNIQTALKNKNASFLFIDTELINIQVWYEMVYHLCPLKILQDIALFHIDLFLLTAPDLPWKQDKLREYEGLQKRKMLFTHYKNYLINQSSRWAIIKGQGEKRLNNAVLEISKQCQNHF